MAISYTSLPTVSPPLGFPDSDRPSKRSPRRKSLSILVGLLLLLAVGVGAFCVNTEELLRAFGSGGLSDSLVDDVGNSETGVVEESVAVISPVLSCPDTVEAAELLRSSRDVNYWIANRSSSHSFSISPKNATLSPNLRQCLADAIFTARLLDTDDELIYLFPYPIHNLSSPGRYDLAIPGELSIPRSSYSVEIRLEFGWLPGARDGMVCGARNASCDAIIMAQGMGIGESEKHYDGRVVRIEGSDRVEMGIESKDLNSKASCTTFSPLAGYWLNQSFHPLTCDLSPISLPLPPSLPSSSPIWFHIIGDSNARNIFSHLATAFGGGSQARFIDERGATVATVALRSSNRNFDRSTSLLAPDVIVTWQWWYQTPISADSGMTVEENIDELRKWVGGDLEGFLVDAGLRKSIDLLSEAEKEFRRSSRGLYPTRTLVSLGSHSETTTALGTTAFLDSLLSPVNPFGNSTTLRYLTTTFVQTGNIPLDKFPNQDLIRSNPIIAARNQLLRNRVAPERIIDVEGMTEGITEAYMKVGRKLDAVHFLPFVYDEMVRVILAEAGIDGNGLLATTVEEGGAADFDRS